VAAAKGTPRGHGTGRNGRPTPPPSSRRTSRRNRTGAEDLELEEAGEKAPNVLVRLYRGETSFDFIGRARCGFAASAVVILLGIVSLSTRD